MSPDADRCHRAELRAVARRLHPDLGGDPEAYLAAVEAVERAHGHRHDRTGSPGDVRVSPSPGSGLRRRLRRARRAVRARLPRRVPGARRYARL